MFPKASAIWSLTQQEKKGKASSEASAAAAKTFKDTYGNDAVNEKTWRRWFSAGGFKNDDFSLKDERRTERWMLKKLNSEQLHAATDENLTCAIRELSKTFHVKPLMSPDQFGGDRQATPIY
ncbi:hypothetical protein ACTXT7_000318 [Hymenolepis weldensis]